MPAPRCRSRRLTFESFGPALLLLGLLLVPVAHDAGASECDSTSKGFTPLDDLGAGFYNGFQGGLYAGGLNAVPPTHLQGGIGQALAIQPLDGAGQPDPVSGSIVLLSIGMCNTSQEYGQFMTLVGGFAGKNPLVAVINGATGGASASRIADSTNGFWDQIDTKLLAAGKTREQVQVAWLKEANAGPTELFPEHADSLHRQIRTAVQIMKVLYPNLRIVYLSSRIYAGYASTALNPEPYAYESGFAIKWLIEQQIGGEPSLNYDPNAGAVWAPWLAWGPYMWADGLTPRSDGLTWECTDFANDGTHPGPVARQKVAQMLLDFFSTDTTATPWFLSGTVSTLPPGRHGAGLTVHLPQPNPFHRSIALTLELTERRAIAVEVMTASGRRLRTLGEAQLGAGSWRFEWDGRDAQGRPVGAGVYFLSVREGESVRATRKVTLIR